MNRFIKSLLFISVLILSGCSGSSGDRLLNLGAVKKVVQNYYESGRYDEDLKRIIDDAVEYFNGLTIMPEATVVFDIDETALSNYEHIKEIDFGYYYEIWLEWLKKSDATAIPQTKRFYDYLISKNIRIVFLSGRNCDSYQATLDNLKQQGYTEFDTVIVRKENERDLTATEFKSSKRKELVSRGYKIIANIGDQKSDLSGGNSGFEIKLPNYIYLID